MLWSLRLLIGSGPEAFLHTSARSGSPKAQAFYAEQQRLWVELLLGFTEDRSKIEDVLQLFQGAVLAFLISGNAEPGRLAWSE